MTGKKATGTGATHTALVIVESPTKANTVRKFLGDRFVVEASVGHVRDLVTKKTELAATDSRRSKPWVQYGVNVDNDFEPLEEIYRVPAEKKRQVESLKRQLQQADALYLATDDDREGEAISWHLLEELKPKVPVKRLVFHEITDEAIQTALSSPRDLDMHLVNAQRTRRVIDRLFGWDVSQVLWRKIKPGLSAGRVQSGALRMLVQRERERMAFSSSEYWDLLGSFAAGGENFEAALVRVGSERVASSRDFDSTTGLPNGAALILTGEAAQALTARLDGRAARVASREVKPQTLRPLAPFTTSTLQQDGNRKLRFSAQHTMRVAQRLYENGFITYMRTDSTTLSGQAIDAARTLISEHFGEKFLPPAPRRYATKSANAQEAHEAIRPAGTRFPSLAEVRRQVGVDEARLYELIWKRTVACQMVDAQVEQTTLEIAVEDTVFRASGRTIRFAGYLEAWDVERAEEQTSGPRERLLPAVAAGDAVNWAAPPALERREHHTRPPARLNDASLVKALEDNGIGRPSTYASIIQQLLERGYCFRRSSALVPTFVAIAVVQMLERYLPHLIDFNFTALMEARLDAIARGEEGCTQYLQGFYREGFEGLDGGDRIQGLVPLLEEVRDTIDPKLTSAIPLGTTEAGEDVQVRIGRYGVFVKVGERTASVADDFAPDEMTVAAALGLISDRERADAPMGVHPETKESIFLRNGRFGWYLQLGTPSATGEKPRMISLSKGMKAEEVDLALAIRQLSLPRQLGDHPKLGAPMEATVGRYGDFLRCGDETRSLPSGLYAIDVTAQEAIDILLKPRARAGRELVRELGVRPEDGVALSLWSGRWGLYVTDGSLNKTLGTIDPATIDVAAAVELLKAAKRARDGEPLGVDPGTGNEIRLIDGRFGPYLTDGKHNASIPNGFERADVDLAWSIERLQQQGKPVRAKGRAGAAKKATAKKTPAKKATAKKAPAKKATATAKPAAG